MKTIEMEQATASLAIYAKNVSKEPVILTVKGMPVAALVSIENTDLETLNLGTNPEFLALIEQSRARRKAEEGISSDEIRHRLGI